jgi:uncharacterized protein
MRHKLKLHGDEVAPSQRNSARAAPEHTVPLGGHCRISVAPASPEELTLFVRIPAWSKQNSVLVGGKEMGGLTAGQCLAIRRRWRSGDKVKLSFDMRPQVAHANPAVADDLGRIALRCGPIVLLHGSARSVEGFKYLSLLHCATN